jgi:hypothetical protein
LTAEATAFLTDHIVGQLEQQIALEAALTSAQAAWEERQSSMAMEAAQRAQVDAALAGRADGGDDARSSFLREGMLGALRRGLGADTALRNAEAAWFTRTQLARLPQLATAAATAAGSFDTAAAAQLELMMRPEVERATSEAEVEAACATAAEDWQRLGRALAAAAEARAVALAAPERARVLEHLVQEWLRRSPAEPGPASGRAMADCATSCVLLWAAERQTREALASAGTGAAAARMIHAVVREELRPSLPGADTGAVASVVQSVAAAWQRIDAAIAAELAKRNVARAAGMEWTSAWARLGAGAPRLGMDEAALGEFVARTVEGWQRDIEQTDARRLEEQSVWDASGNETRGATAVTVASEAELVEGEEVLPPPDPSAEHMFCLESEC